MPRRVQVLVLCEDTLHQSFAAAFLKRAHLKLRVAPYIKRSGSRRNVLHEVPQMVREVRKPGSEKHLLVLVDLDVASLPYIRRQISERLRFEGLNQLTEADNVLIVGAKREVDNWVAYLRGQQVEEHQQYPVEDAQGRFAGRRLAELCEENAQLSNAPPSLVACCKEWLSYRIAKGI